MVIPVPSDRTTKISVEMNKTNERPAGAIRLSISSSHPRRVGMKVVEAPEEHREPGHQRLYRDRGASTGPDPHARPVCIRPCTGNIAFLRLSARGRLSVRRLTFETNH